MSTPYANLADLAPLRDQLEKVAGSHATLALARGRLVGGAKKPVDAGWLETPLSPEQEAEWDAEVAKGTGAFFFLLLRQCEPQLLVLDIDDPSQPFAKDLKRMAEKEGWWFAPSTSKGAHVLLRADVGLREVVPGDKAMVPLGAPRKGSRQCGEILTNAAVAYRPTKPGSKVEALCDAEGLFTMLTGKPLSPKARLEGLLERTRAEILAFPEGARNNMLFKLCVTMSRRLKTIGALAELPQVAAKIAEWYSEANPGDKRDAASIRERIQEFDDGSTENEMPEGLHARLLRSVYNQIDDRHGGHILIDGAAGLGDLRPVHAWDMVATDWKVMTYLSQNETLDGGLNESFSAEIGKVVDSTFLDIVGEVPDLGKKHECVEAVWAEFRSNRSVAHINQAFDQPIPGEAVNHFNLGDGTVLRVSALAADHARGEAVRVVENRPEFRAARRLCTPTMEENTEFIQRVEEVWPEEGVAEYLRMRWAEMLVPQRLHSPDFLSFYGEGGNGKSMIHDALLAAFGEFGITSDITAIKRNQGEPSPRTLGARANMVGARMVVFHEAGKDPMDEEALKSIVAGNKIKVGGMYTKPYDSHIFAKLCIMTNKPLRLDEVGAAMTRRACQVPCNKCFDDGVKEVVDRGMPDRLVAGKGGILRMIINDISRYLDLRHAGEGVLKKPAAVKEQTRAWLESQDPYQAHLKTFFTVDRSPDIPKMKQGRISKEGKSSGLAAVVEALMGDFYRCNPTHEAKRFVSRTRCAGRRPSDLYLVPTPVFAEWCATRDDISDDERRDLFLGVFRVRSHADKVYGKMYDDAVEAADTEPTEADSTTTEDSILSDPPPPQEDDIPW